MIGPSAGSRRLACLAMTTTLLGCANLASEFRGPAPAPLPPALVVLPTPPGYPGELAAMQSIRAAHAEGSDDFEAYLQVGPERVAIVLTLPFGPRIAAIDWSAAGIETRHERDLPPALQPLAERFWPANVLADIVMAFWPEAAVRASLAPDVALDVEPGTRHFSYRDRAAVTVRYSGGDPWATETTVIHHLLGYRLAITSCRLPGA